MTDDATKRRWRWVEPGHKYEQTLLARAIEPVVDFVVRTGEIIVLAGVFSTAAHATRSLTAAALSQLMFLALGLHFGIAYGRYVLRPLQGLIIKPDWLAILVASTVGGAIGVGWYFLWFEIVAVAKGLAAHA
jgi:hypothetical protein